MKDTKPWQAALAGALLAGTAIAAHADEGDVAAGRALYAKTCFVCHFAIEDETSDAAPVRVPVMMATWGPTLKGIVGRPAGAVADFRYSQSFMEATAGLVWTEENLDRFIEDSQVMAPLGLMFFREPDRTKRRQIIAYLKTSR